MLAAPQWWLGIGIAVSGNVLISLALNFQKLAHLRIQARASAGEQTPLLPGPSGEPRGASTAFLRSRLWWSGIALMTLGETGNFLSYGFAPASLVAPLGAVSLLSNVIFAPALLHETIESLDLVGIALAIVGAVAVVLSAGGSGDAPLDPPALWRAICEPTFVIYALCAVALGCALMLLSLSHAGGRVVLVDIGACAVFGGFTVLATKGVSSFLLRGSSLSDLVRLLREPLFFALLLVIAATAMIQLTFLNRALQRFDSRQVIPTQFVLFTISTIIGSSILYKDFARTSAARLTVFSAGCLVTFSGVFVLTRAKPDEEDESPQEEVAGEPATGEDVTEVQIPVPCNSGQAQPSVQGSSVVPVAIRSAAADAHGRHRSNTLPERGRRPAHKRSRSGPRHALAAVAAIVGNPQSYLLTQRERSDASSPAPKRRRRARAHSQGHMPSGSLSRILPSLFSQEGTYAAISEPSGSSPSRSAVPPPFLGISPGRNLLVVSNPPGAPFVASMPTSPSGRSLDPMDAHGRGLDPAAAARRASDAAQAGDAPRDPRPTE